MNRRCMNCMNEYSIPAGYENNVFACPFCGYREDEPPKEVYFLRPGTVLGGRYTIGIVLGAGGFGITYKAWDKSLGTLVAIKEHYPTTMVQRVIGENNVIVSNKKNGKEYYALMERFLEEARIMAKFHDNPNIVDVDNFFEENNTAYMVMEYLDGISLKGYLEQEKGRLEPSFAVEITMSVISALRETHAKSILHRDISPDNVFLCLGNRVVLIDFGAARLSDEENEKTRTIVLKPGYAPPEQYVSKSRQGPWTDIYALSAMLYRMVTGHLPDESTNRLEEDEVKLPMELVPSIPEHLSNTIMKGMAINPELRFKNVDELQKALLNEKKVCDLKKELKVRKQRRLIGIASALVLLVIGGITAYLIYDKKDPALDAAAITIWVSYDEDEDKDAKEKMLMDMSESFMSDQPAIEVNAVAIPKDEYNEKLEEALEEGSMPTLFESDLVSDRILDETASVGKVYDSLDDMKDYYFISDYEDELSECRQVPLGFDVPVAYVRRGENIDVSTVEVSDFEEMRKLPYYIVPEYYAMHLKSLGAEYDYKTDIVLPDSAKKMLDEMSVDALKKGGLPDKEKAFTSFCNGEITYYQSDFGDYWKFINDKNVAGYFEIRPIAVESLYGEFSNLYSISNDADEDEMKAARMWLRYMLEEGPQKTMHIVNKNTLPINKAAYEEFMNTNGKCKFIDSYIEKLKFYPESQAALREISIKLYKEVVLNKDKSTDKWLDEQ